MKSIVKKIVTKLFPPKESTAQSPSVVMPTVTKDIPIIAVTAVREAEDIKKMHSAGITDYISKPFKSEELVEKIKKHLQVIS